MLKAIELSGFKSFADRTKLEFGEGVCAIVGPNGSGKSNIIDAIKWCLGEKSMKKLRSGESTDVIFNGSAERAPLGTAEVTLSFNNRNHIFDLDTPEVHITRRIYRSGEGEYLINRQASRLKDIKTLLAGTGLGTQAYSIIEQGRVESLLNSSAEERRELFDEAAGISLFNTRKQEIQRRYERVEQNLVRLGDKVTEIEHQLKSARSQADKAQLFRQYNERIKELRLLVAGSELRVIEQALQAANGELQGLQDGERVAREKVRTLEDSLEECNGGIENIDQVIRRHEGTTATVRQQISGNQSTINLLFGQLEETAVHLPDGIAGNRYMKYSAKIQSLTADIQKTQKTYSDIADEYQKRKDDEAALATRTNGLEQRLVNIDTATSTAGNTANTLRLNCSVIEERLETLRKGRTHTCGVAAKQSQTCTVTATELEEMQSTVAGLEENADACGIRLNEARQRKSSRAREHAEVTQQLSERKQRQSGLKERISLLEELIQRNEGLSPGVREVLQQRSDTNSPFRHVFGLVADLLRVEFSSASLIELALGSVSQHIVVRPKAELFRHIEKNAADFAGRVGFIWLDSSEQEAEWMKTYQFAERKNVLGRADQFVQTEPKFQHLARRLLGRIWIVKDIAAARQLYKESDDRTSFLTVSGEMLTPDGSLIVGPLNAASGLITRRSELRKLAEEITALDKEVLELEIAVSIAKDRVDSDEIDVEDEAREHQKAVTEFEAKKLQHKTLEEKYKVCLEQSTTLAAEIVKFDSQITETQEQLQENQAQIAQLDAEIADLEIQRTAMKQDLAVANAELDEHRRKTVDMEIELATSKERLESLREKFRHYDEQLQERQRVLAEHRQQYRIQQQRRDAVELKILQTEASSALLYRQKEQLRYELAEHSATRREAVLRRVQIQAELKRLQGKLETQQTKINKLQIQIERYCQEQKTITDRMKEDYGIDIKVSERDFVPVNVETDINSESVKAELNKLKEQVQRLGNVNLEAVTTLDDLETQYKTHSERYNDITSAKKLIERQIELLNVDSQRLFSETFEGVRCHFQELFRQLFGGGSADLVLDNPDKPLESGVDIIAKPPGKDLKNIMLLSGGEKTLTCFALLLAFFRYKPNPVCILDECDAALDEGNIDRYNSVIKEFSKDTQFLLITHRKESMTHASSIYGITMQESGISKPASVQFIDVGANGELLRAA
ncbi:chromosome partition protein Smc [Planctomycetales bacterium]|nr:chromosome partition protein Smc [Planctomycetales bacterium]